VFFVLSLFPHAAIAIEKRQRRISAIALRSVGKRRIAPGILFRIIPDQQRTEVRMKGDAKVIEFLNGVLKNELTAINQYFLHSRMFANWGVSELAEKEYKESVDEMKHADKLVKRILFLDGLPNLQDLGKLMIGEDIVECLDCDLKLEMDSMPLLRDAIQHCEKVRDYVSRELFEDILESEEEHVDWLETQKGIIGRIGVERFILLQSEPNEKGD
jgi:bacterioferritin